jgi:hypothetical protein
LLVEHVREDVFAGARLAEERDGHVGRREAIEQREHLAHRRATRCELSETPERLEVTGLHDPARCLYSSRPCANC